MGFPHHLLTFEKGICCKGKERQLKHKLAKQEGLKPRWGALEQSVFELLGIPLAQVSQLGKDGDRDECSHLAGQARQLQPTGRAPQYPAPLASGTLPALAFEMQPRYKLTSSHSGVRSAQLFQPVCYQAFACDSAITHVQLCCLLSRATVPGT